MAKETDSRITKRRVTMRSAFLGSDGKTYTHEAIDYVPDDDRDVLEAYLAQARANWQHVEVSEEFDAGPGGYDGATYVPESLAHGLAGSYFPATGEDDDAARNVAPRGARIVRADENTEN